MKISGLSALRKSLNPLYFTNLYRVVPLGLEPRTP